MGGRRGAHLFFWDLRLLRVYPQLRWTEPQKVWGVSRTRFSISRLHGVRSVPDPAPGSGGWSEGEVGLSSVSSKGAEEERREVTVRVFSKLLELGERSPPKSHLPWGPREAVSLQDPPRRDGRYSHGLHQQLHIVLSNPIALKPAHVCLHPASSRPPCLQSPLSSPSPTWP